MLLFPASLQISSVKYVLIRIYCQGTTKITEKESMRHSCQDTLVKKNRKFMFEKNDRKMYF